MTNLLVLGAVVTTCAAVVLRAGPLDPPSGPVASTYKTLGDVEPRIAVSATNTPGSGTSQFVISQPGSYYLTGNITGVSGKNGIEIAAGRVTLDLNGFTLNGVTGSVDGIRVSGSSRYAVTVRNGAVSGWGGFGVNFGTSLSYCAESLHVDNTGNTGILGAYDGRIQGCSARSCGVDGISASDPCVIDSCTAVFNASAGIRASIGRATITNCIALINTGQGIAVFDGCLVRDNQSSNNGVGILVTGFGNRIEGNNLSLNTTGIRVNAAGNLIISNSVNSSTTAFQIAANNRYGPIVNITASGSAGVTGASAPSTLTSTDPWTNFAY